MLEKKCKKCKSQWRLVSPFGWRLVSPFVLRPVSPFGRRPVSPFGQRPVSPFGGRLDIYTYMHQRQKCEINQGLFCRDSQITQFTLTFQLSVSRLGVWNCYISIFLSGGYSFKRNMKIWMHQTSNLKFWFLFIKCNRWKELFNQWYVIIFISFPTIALYYTSDIQYNIHYVSNGQKISLFMKSLFSS